MIYVPDTDKAPTMHDMFVAGIPFRMGLALSQDIAREPEVQPATWWTIIREYQERAAAARSAGPASC